MSEDDTHFDAAQVRRFLDRIAADRGARVAEIEAEGARAVAQARRSARAAARQFHRRASVDARARLESDHTRKLSRARAEFRRQRWRSLEGLQAQAREAIRAEFARRWQRPAARRAWCGYWLELAAARAGADTTAQVRVGGCERDDGIVARARDIGFTADVVFDPGAPAGIVIDRGRVCVDGSLESQVGPVLASVSRDLARWLHELPVDAREQQ